VAITILLKETYSIRLRLALVVVLSSGSLLIASCRGPSRKNRHKRESGRQSGTGVPAKMLDKVIASGGEKSELENQGVHVYNAPYNQVFKAVRKTMAIKEYPVLKRDVENGIIETDYRIHDGLFALGFLGKKTRSKMVAKLKKLEPEKTEVTLMIFVEKEGKDKTWQEFPITDYDLDLIDSDSIEIYFHLISEQLTSQKTSES
jgi:hypothetical protein